MIFCHAYRYGVIYICSKIYISKFTNTTYNLEQRKNYSLHSVLIDIFTYGTMTKGTTSVLINLINATDFFVGPPIF